MKQKILRSILPAFLVSCAATAFLFSGAATLLTTTGCKSSSTEQVIQTTAVVTTDAADGAMTLWGHSWAAREASAQSTTNIAAIASLAKEQTDVQTALTAYQMATATAIQSWIAAKGVTNSPSAAVLAGFSTAFALSETNLITLLQSHP
jgi:hypothetical protein